MPIKVENSSDYWRDNDENNQSWYFYWRASAYDFLYEYREAFMSHYLDLVETYGFLLPLCYFDETEVADSKNDFLGDFFEGIRSAKLEEQWLPLHQLYNLDPDRTGDQVFPSLIFNHPTAPPRPLVDIIGNKAVSNMQKSGAPAVKLWASVYPDRRQADIGVHLHHDAFDLILHNSKTYEVTSESEEKGVDNIDLSILNAPRFNSFFREFRRLADHFGAEVTVEVAADTSLDGFLYDGTANMYEDWVDELPEHGRIVTAKTLQDLTTLAPKYDRPKVLDPKVFEAWEIDNFKRTRARKQPWEWDPDYLKKKRLRSAQMKPEPEPKRIIDIAARDSFIEDPVADLNRSLFQKPIDYIANQGETISERAEVYESDVHDLLVETYLRINHRSLGPNANQWAQLTTNIVAPAFDLDTAKYKAHLQALSFPFMGLSIEPEDIQASFEAIDNVVELDDDILCTLAVLMSDKNFHERTAFFETVAQWVQSKKWGDCFGYSFVTNFSFRQIAAMPNGQNFLRKKIIECPILKVK